MDPNGTVVSYNLFAYCNNNPINKNYKPSNRTHGILARAAESISGTVTESTTSSSSASSISTISAPPSFCFANHVNRIHYTTPTLMLDLSLLGRAGFSSTLTEQDANPGLFYSYSDIGNDSDKFGVGINAGGWLGIGLGVSSDESLFVNAQLTPWVHGQVSVGIDGVGGSISVDIGNTSHDLEIKAGWGLAFAFLIPQIIGIGWQSPGFLMH